MDASSEEEQEQLQFAKTSHVDYFLATLHRGLPEFYASLDTSRLSAVYFSVVGLDLLGALEALGEEGKRNIIEYIYAMQIPADETGTYPGHCGFVGSSYMGQPFGECSCLVRNHRPSSSSTSSSPPSSQLSPLNTHPMLHSSLSTSSGSSAYELLEGHLAMAYVSLAILITLGDDLARVDKTSLVAGMRHHQQPNGSFSATLHGSECDTRFVYCACAVSYILDDWSGVDRDAATSYILSCVSYEGGIALTPGAEAHGGSTYCGTAALVLMDRLDALGSAGVEALSTWCQQRQIGGYQGRTNKEPDSCYSFWIGATLQLLGAFHDTDLASTLVFLLSTVGGCQNPHPSGGFCKTPESYPDVLHSFYSVCWLAMAMASREEGDKGERGGEGEEDKGREGWELEKLDVRLAINAKKVPRAREF